MARRTEGYLMVDHRESPGIGHNRPGGKLLEAATKRCNHCQMQIIRNPARKRERHHCKGCDSYICDRCALIMKVTGECRPFEKVVEQFLERQAKLIA